MAKKPRATEIRTGPTGEHVPDRGPAIIERIEGEDRPGKGGRRGGVTVRTGRRHGSQGRLTPLRHKLMYDLIATGSPRTAAAEAAGITRNTLEDWIRIGVAERALGSPLTIYGRLSLDIERAEAVALAHSVLDVVQRRRQDPRLALQWLERRYPDQFGRVIADVRHSGVVAQVHAEVDLGALLDMSGLSDEQLAIVEARLAEAPPAPSAIVDATYTEEDSEDDPAKG